MAIGTSRRNSFAVEKAGWGGYFTTVQANALSGATTLVLVGMGGNTEGVPTVAAGMSVFFLEDMTEPANLITAVANVGGNASLTVSALVNNQDAGKKVVVGYKADKALLLDAFSSDLKMNKWGPQPFSGTRAKNTSRRKGRREAEGSMEFMLRPAVNAPIMTKAIGTDSNVYGTDPTVPVTTTLAALIAAGDTTANLTSAASLVVGDTVQIEANGSASVEVRKITNIAVNVITVDQAFDFGHANAAAVKKVVAPFIHTVHSAIADLPSFAMEDYIPYDGATNNVTTSSSYYLPGCKMKSLKVNSASEHGANCSMDYEAQDKVEIKANSALTLTNEDPYIFEQEAVLINGTRNKRIEDISIEVENDLQKVFAKTGFSRAFALKAGQQEVKGSLKLYEDDASQDTFWTALDLDTQLSLVWTITDQITGYYVKFTVPKIVIDEFNDGNFSPADLIHAELKWTAILDAGATNEQISVEVANGDYLPYN